MMPGVPPGGSGEPAAGRLRRERLIDAILQFLGTQDLLTIDQIRGALEEEIDTAGPEAVVQLRARLVADSGWDFYPRDPLAQRIHHRLADRFLDPGSELVGAHHLDQVVRSPVVICANHLSYADANVIEVLLQRSGAAGLAERLTVLAGPKVFTSRERRFSSLCFGTIKVPQSPDVSSEEAVLNGREVARAARRAMDVARSRLSAGDTLLLFGEGTRSRTSRMQRMLRAAARYLDPPAEWILPLGLAGPEQLFGVEDATLRPAPIMIQAGSPIRADALRNRALGDRRVMMDAIGLAIAELIPPPYRGAYADGESFPDARAVLGSLRTSC